MPRMATIDRLLDSLLSSELSLRLMPGHPRCPLGGLVFAVILDVLEDLVREVQLPVYVAGIRVVGVRTDREVLLFLPLEDALALGRVVASLLNLLHESSSLIFVGVRVLGEPLDQLLFVEEVVSHHGEGKPPIVADVFSLV